MRLLQILTLSLVLGQIAWAGDSPNGSRPGPNGKIGTFLKARWNSPSALALRRAGRATLAPVKRGAIYVGNLPPVKASWSKVIKAGEAYGRAADKVEATIIKGCANKSQQIRQNKRARFAAKVLSAKPGQEIRISGRGKSIAMTDSKIASLSAALRPLVRELAQLDLRVTSSDGSRRLLGIGEVKAAFEMLALLERAAKAHEIIVPSDAISMSHLLGDHGLAAAVLQAAQKSAKKPWSAERRRRFMQRYQKAREAFGALDQAYQVFIRHDGVRNDPLLRQVCKGIDKDTVVVVASATHTPRRVKRATDTLVKEYLNTIASHLIDPLMSGDSKAFEERLPKLFNKKDQAKIAKLLQTIVSYRDSEAVPIIAIRNGKRDRQAEGQIRDQLREKIRAVAKETIKTDFKKQKSEGSRDAFLKIFVPVLAATSAVKYLSRFVPVLGSFVPVIAGGADDIAGIAPNLASMKDNGADDSTRTASKAMAFAGATSLSVAAPLGNGQSIAKLMFNPNAGMWGALASFIYGVASSGGSLYMGTFGAKYLRERISKNVALGLLDPKDSKGRSLRDSPKKLERWIKRKALREHLTYDPAQLAGLVGAFLSGVAGAAVYGATGNWGGAWAPLWLNVVGSGESTFTAAVLWGGEAHGRRRARTVFRAGLKSLSRGIQAAR